MFVLVPHGSQPGLKATAGDPFEGTPYRSVRLLGRGGMGEVFLVEHRELGRKFVAKLLRSKLASEPKLVDRLRVEAQALARLEHRHVVSVVGFDQTPDGRHYIVMEYLRGRTLGEELRARRLSVAQAVDLALQALSALSAAHSLGIVHRDLKPANLYLAETSRGLELKVLDFGVARILPGVSPAAPLPVSVPTETGMMLGTPRFTSPEAASGQRVDHRADLYSLGLVLYTMLAGRGPFDHVSGSDGLLSAHAQEQPAAPSRFAARPLPPELDRAVLRALCKSPSQRFQSADEFAAELRYVAELLQFQKDGESSVFTSAETEGTVLVRMEPERAPAHDDTWLTPPPSVSARGAQDPRAALWTIFFSVALVTTGVVAVAVNLLLRAGFR